MAIVRTVDWRLRISPEQADVRVRAAFDQLGLATAGGNGHITGRSKMNILKNRPPATVTADITPFITGALVALRIEAGAKHYSVASDIASAIGEDAFDDRGLTAAQDRLRKISKVGGWLELRHIRNFLTPTETVLELGQGVWDNDQGLVVLSGRALVLLRQDADGGHHSGVSNPGDYIRDRKQEIAGRDPRYNCRGQRLNDYPNGARRGRWSEPSFPQGQGGVRLARRAASDDLCPL